jgi:hypothetical protein
VPAGGKDAQRRALDPAAGMSGHRPADHIEDAHDAEGRGQVGAQVLHLEPDRCGPLGVEGEQLSGEPRRRVPVEVPVRHDDAPVEQSFVEVPRPAPRVDPDPDRRHGRVLCRTGRPGRMTRLR